MPEVTVERPGANLDLSDLKALLLSSHGAVGSRAGMGRRGLLLPAWE